MYTTLKEQKFSETENVLNRGLKWINGNQSREVIEYPRHVLGTECSETEKFSLFHVQVGIEMDRTYFFGPVCLLKASPAKSIIVFCSFLLILFVHQ